MNVEQLFLRRKQFDADDATHNMNLQQIEDWAGWTSDRLFALAIDVAAFPSPQDALDAAQPGDTVLFSEDITIEDTLTCNTSYVTIESRGAVITASSSFPSTDSMFKSIGATKQIISLRLDGNGQAKWGVDHRAGINCEIDRCEVTNCGVGIVHQWGTDDTISRCRCYGNTNEGIVTEGSGGQDDLRTLIVRCVCNLNGTDTGGNLGWGIVASDYVRHPTIALCRCKDNYQGGISVDVLLSGGDLNLYDTDALIIGNQLKGYSGSHASHLIHYQGGIGGAIVGNAVDGAATNGIRLNSRAVDVSGNDIRNSGTWGISAHGSNPTAFTPAAGLYTIGPNVFDNNTSGKITEDAVIAGTNSYVQLTTTVTP